MYKPYSNIPSTSQHPNIMIETENIHTKPRPRHLSLKKRKHEMWKMYDLISKKSDESGEEKEEVGERCSCIRCQHLLAYSEEGFLTCTNTKCGLIHKDMIDQSAEWRYYGADDNQSSDPSRCGLPTNPLLKESSFGCKVLSGFGSKSYEMKKIQRFTEWQSMPAKEHVLLKDFQFISNICQNEGLPKIIIDDALYFHKCVMECDLHNRGSNRMGQIIGSVKLACQKNHYPIIIKELASKFPNSQSATKESKHVQQIMQQLAPGTVDVGFHIKAESFIERYCSQLNINNELTKLCEFICLKIEKLGLLVESTPHSVATGVIFFVANVCGQNINKKEVKRISDISEVTLNKCFKQLDKHRQVLIPPMLAVKYRVSGV